ncbi:hypothetical protein SAMN05519104_2043 [Rhizobiales bacterium GAS188]|nr:hypothetical protein SAMN05519104_2043 [Rhizobiales bacterium GAS188]
MRSMGDADPLTLTAEQLQCLLEDGFRRAFCEIVDTLIGDYGETVMAEEMDFIAEGRSPYELATEEMRAVMTAHEHWFGLPQWGAIRVLPRAIHA